MGMTVAPETEQLLREQVATGRYSSTEEALREAVRLLVERERRRAELGAQVQASIDQIERGEFTELGECDVDGFLDEIQAEAMESFAPNVSTPSFLCRSCASPRMRGQTCWRSGCTLLVTASRLLAGSTRCYERSCVRWHAVRVWAGRETNSGPAAEASPWDATSSCTVSSVAW